MNENEARIILAQELAKYRARPYNELALLDGRSEHFERIAPSGTAYQVEIQVFWDDKSKQSLRVQGAIDDGGLLRGMIPWTEDFIILPDGSFVGE